MPEVRCAARTKRATSSVTVSQAGLEPVVRKVLSSLWKVREDIWSDTVCWYSAEVELSAPSFSAIVSVCEYTWWSLWPWLWQTNPVPSTNRQTHTVNGRWQWREARAFVVICFSFCSFESCSSSVLVLSYNCNCYCWHVSLMSSCCCCCCCY